MDIPILNADLGEGETTEATEELIRRLGAANIACGGHAGDDCSMRSCLRLCRTHGTRAGAHPGMPGAFGRGQEVPPPAEFKKLLEDQWNRLSGIAGDEGIPLHHIKLHGRLYSAVEENADLREVYLNFLSRIDRPPVCFCLASGRLAKIATSRNLPVWREAFADRSYEEDGSLTPRSHPDAVLDSLERIRKRIEEWLKNGTMETRTGSRIPLEAETLCIHSDSPCARETLEELTRIRPCS